MTKNRSQMYYALSTVLITLAGFMFIASSGFFVMEKTYAIEYTHELRENILAQERNESLVTVTWYQCFLGRCTEQKSLVQQSESYHNLVTYTFLLGWILVLSSLICIRKGYLHSF